MSVSSSSLVAVLVLTTLRVGAQVPVPAPGLAIPSGAVPYALDHFAGVAELVPVHHSSIEVNNHRGSNIAGSVNPFFKQKLTTELAGDHARTVIHDLTPSFYIHLAEDPDGGGDTANSEATVFALVHATVEHAGESNARRIFAQVKLQSLTGSAKRADGVVETTTEKLPDGWLKLTPAAALAPGEYALTPIPKAQNAFATTVYDFTVDPAAANAKDAVMARP